MIKWRVEVEDIDIDCPVDDIKEMEVALSRGLV